MNQIENSEQDRMKLHTMPPAIGCCGGIGPAADDIDVPVDDWLIGCLIGDGDCSPYCIFWLGTGLFDKEGPVGGGGIGCCGVFVGDACF